MNNVKIEVVLTPYQIELKNIDLANKLLNQPKFSAFFMTASVGITGTPVKIRIARKQEVMPRKKLFKLPKKDIWAPVVAVFTIDENPNTKTLHLIGTNEENTLLINEFFSPLFENWHFFNCSVLQTSILTTAEFAHFYHFLAIPQPK